MNSRTKSKPEASKLVQEELPKVKPPSIFPEKVLKAERILRTSADTSSLYTTIAYCRDSGSEDHYDVCVIRAETRGLKGPKIQKLLADFVNVSKFDRPKKRKAHRDWA